MQACGRCGTSEDVPRTVQQRSSSLSRATVVLARIYMYLSDYMRGSEEVRLITYLNLVVLVPELRKAEI